ncbi:succinate--hydroxymethylglutarate CoA-transferase [Bacillus rossius redtenbacheri]|uniref:succinate--hydroxymethylglutarate CoA-transferase n=1 Tax=Bacillus rossius redtenbacheri TaxID=93214 RepID=UPI002FDDDA6E
MIRLLPCKISANKLFSVNIDILFVLKKHFRCISNLSSKSDTSTLSGIRIMDLTRIVAGPYCTMILGDLGAEIIKIEMPGVGDESRKWGPRFSDDCTDGCYFLASNRNKKSICVDLKSASGKEIMYNLAKCSDVFVENYVPGKLEEFGLDYESMRKVAPHLVYCSITGFGSEGPYRKQPGYDVIAASMGGLVHITGPADGEPCKVGVAITDITTGLYAHGAILAGLLHRQRTGRGQKIDCNLLSTQVSCLINVASNYLNAGIASHRYGTAHESIVPYETFPTKDGRYLTVGAASDKQYESLCKLMNLPSFASDPRFCSNRLRVENRSILIPQLRAHFRQKALDEWLSIFKEAPFPNGPVNNIEQVFSDPHIKEIGLVKELAHASGRTCKVVGPPVVYSESTNVARSAPPVLGQHTDEVLKSILGYTDEKIHALRSENAVS